MTLRSLLLLVVLTAKAMASAEPALVEIKVRAATIEEILQTGARICFAKEVTVQKGVKRLQRTNAGPHPLAALVTILTEPVVNAKGFVRVVTEVKLPVARPLADDRAVLAALPLGTARPVVSAALRRVRGYLARYARKSAKARLTSVEVSVGPLQPASPSSSYGLPDADIRFRFQGLDRIAVTDVLLFPEEIPKQKRFCVGIAAQRFGGSPFERPIKDGWGEYIGPRNLEGEDPP